ncbi:MAG: 50S ribosomal protein L23 [Firmicutes bacterium]|jgi:large subunit ribosomal protein L23|nr:50S ribosomal protein L23 [Bacillota bacterium]
MLAPHDVLIKPIITEKTSILMADKKYTFKVDPRANKIEIRQAVEKIFDVKVASVRTMHVKGKKRRVGVNVGYTSNWKKAVVTLTEDSKPIGFFDGY